MKTRHLYFLIVFFLTTAVFSQKSNLEFTFTAVDSSSYVQLDSIKVMNRTQGDENMIYWPDTSISLEIAAGDTLLYVGYATFYSVGINDIKPEAEQFRVFQNYPNPVTEQSMVSMFIPKNGKVRISVSDVQGRIILLKEYQLERGRQDFRFVPGSGKLFFLTASWNGRSESIKILSTKQQAAQKCVLDHIGSSYETISLKASSWPANGSVKESGIIDMPVSNNDYTFQFMDNGPCPGTPTVSYGGQVYNTVQILSQCWLKENLNIGTMIDVSEDMTDNGTIEKYCYDNHLDSCAKYGGLYQWPEMMQYSTLQGTQGICPVGWHIPTDDEWKILEGAVDSQFGIGDPEWDISYYFRGFDAGYNLKTTQGWYEGGNGSDLYGFSGLPAGARGYDGGVYLFVAIGAYCNLWSSTRLNEYADWAHVLGYPSSGVLRMPSSTEYGYSLRCLKND